MNFESEADEKLNNLIAIMNKKKILKRDKQDDELNENFDSASSMILISGNPRNFEQILSANK
jgi:hypothetical protein